MIFHENTHTQPFYSSMDFIRDNPGEPVPKETFTHSHPLWSSNISICFLHLLRSMRIKQESCDITKMTARCADKRN